ncbi:MAG: cysteine--tRNA ligase, partial [Blastochloris sp.]|nr:cysteine--tRNA ligase [Blastochloris sp.]
DKKMSKSDGNLYTLADLEQRGHTAMELRYVLIAARYSKPLNFTLDSLCVARQALLDLRRFEEQLTAHAGSTSPLNYEAAQVVTDGVFEKSWNALRDNLNTPEALGQLHLSMAAVATRLREAQLQPQEALSIHQSFHRLLHGLGLLLPAPAKNSVPAEIQALANARWDAKQSKDWEKADELRSQLSAAGWSMQDGKEAYTLEPLPK